MENNYCVYIHINKINNKKYIGITKTSTVKRWGKNGSGYTRDKNSVFGRSIEKYGWENFIHEIFETLRTRDKRYGYNIQPGGQLGNAGVIFSEESREKMRKSKVGKKLSEEHKKHISDSLKGHKPPNFTEESKDKLRSANLGKTLSDETRAKISNALLGIVRSEETKQKISDNHANKHSVFCPQLNEYFDVMSDVTRKYGIPRANIDKCIKGERKSAGKHPVTGEKLTWIDMKK